VLVVDDTVDVVVVPDVVVEVAVVEVAVVVDVQSRPQNEGHCCSANSMSS